MIEQANYSKARAFAQASGIIQYSILEWAKPDSTEPTVSCFVR